jgi:hypothetical protein
MHWNAVPCIEMYFIWLSFQYILCYNEYIHLCTTDPIDNPILNSFNDFGCIIELIILHV